MQEIVASAIIERSSSGTIILFSIKLKIRFKKRIFVIPFNAFTIQQTG
jgi:hypothetical protein